MAVINLPTMEQFDKMNDYLAIMAGVGHVKLLDAYEIQRAIRNGTIRNIVSEGDFFMVGRGGTDWLFQVDAFDYDVPARSGYEKSMRIMMYPVFNNVAFDAREAVYYADEVLAPGTYWFQDSRTSKYVSFALSQPVPAGGQIVMGNDGLTPDYTFTSAISYASQTSTVAIETVAVAISDTEPGETQLTPVNHSNRARWGSGNWLQSAIRQWLNSDAASGWWAPSNIYDRPQTSPASGFLYGIDEDLRACIGKVRLRTGLNPFDSGGETFGYSDNEELIFLPSRSEMGLGNSATEIFETPVTAGGEAKTDTLPLYKKDADRIKYLSGVARGWWLRSPHPSLTDADGAYYVNTPGALDSHYASTAHGAVPACVIY